MKKYLSIILIGLAMPALAGNSDETLRKNLAQLDQLIKANTINLKELYAKRSAILKKLGGAKGKAAQTKKLGPYAAKNKAEYAKKKYEALKAKKDAIAKKKAAAAKQSGTKKPGAKKPTTKKLTTKKPTTKKPTKKKPGAKKPTTKKLTTKKPTTKKPTKKKPGTKKPTTKKPTTKKPTTKKKPAKSAKSSKTTSAIHKKAEAGRANFLKRFDQNRDGKVTKDEAKSVLAAEAKARATGREKKKKK